MRYSVDINSFGCYDEGGYSQFYRIKENKSLGFKEFKNKRLAKSAFDRQKLLSRFNLAPKIISNICILKIDDYYNTDWGFITEKAKILSEKTMGKRLYEIQNLVEDIENKTGLKFWDCHYWNVGYIKRYNKQKLVCIDTGNESFNRDCNAWGFSKPGPKCNYCKKYQCTCADY